MKRTLVSLVCVCAFGLGLSAPARAEVLVRWDRDRVPSPESLGLSTLVVPAKDRGAVQRALARGYRVYLEVDAATAPAFVPPVGNVAGVLVTGAASAAQLAQLQLRLRPRGLMVRTYEERGKWPHVRSNLVAGRDGVLQVASRTSQPWVENNAALIRLARLAQPDVVPLLTYPWVPTAGGALDEGPEVEDYLVAIAEVASFGADLVLPLHARLQDALLLGLPEARAGWQEIRDAIAFASWELPGRYDRAANVGVLTTDAMRWFEVMNLLARHNLSFDLVKASRESRDLSAFDLVVVLDPPSPAQVEALSAFAQQGGIVVLSGLTGAFPWQSAGAVKADERVTYPVGTGRVVEMREPVSNPDTFALEVRRLLGRDRRIMEIWNGITVLAASYTAPALAAGADVKPAPTPAPAVAVAPAAAGEPGTVLLTLVNYAHEKLPVQMRVPGTFSAVRYESPEEAPALLPYQQRDGFTEFVVPALRVGGRLFLTREAR